MKNSLEEKGLQAKMASWFFIGKPYVASVCKPSMAGVSKPPMASVHKLDIAISSGPSCRCCA